MTDCYRGLSCEPVRETMSLCQHGTPVKLGCYTCSIDPRLNKLESHMNDENVNVTRINDLELMIYRSSERIETLEEKISEKYAHPNVIDRIERLERLYNASTDVEQMLINKFKELEEKIKQIENLRDLQLLKDIVFEGAQTHSSILRCEKGLEDLEKLFYDEKAKFRCNDKKPHKCPVCDGISYRSPVSFDPCHVCSGKGIIWG